MSAAPDLAPRAERSEQVAPPVPRATVGHPLWRRAGYVAAAYLVCVVVFTGFATVQGADPLTLFSTMLNFSVLDWGTLQQTLIRSVPIALAALACTIPGRAGLVNVGGEGQIVIGGVAAVGVGLAIAPGVGGPAAWLLIGLGAAIAGGAWAGICGWLRVRLHASESVTTLFFNFIAVDIALIAIYQLWREENGSGLPQTEPLTAAQMLPTIPGTRLSLSVPIMLVIAGLVWATLRYTNWGFALGIAGGNPEAAARAGLPVRTILVSAMVMGGALAGLGGALNLMGVEGALRPGMTMSFGYIAFLANFLGGNRPLPVIGAAVLFSAIANSSNGLQLVQNLPGSAVNVLLGLIVMTMLVVSGRRDRAVR